MPIEVFLKTEYSSEKQMMEDLQKLLHRESKDDCVYPVDNETICICSAYKSMNGDIYLDKKYLKKNEKNTQNHKIH